MYNLLSIGALAVDIVLESDKLPENDGFQIIQNETLLPGGSASNMSVCAANLGINVYQTGQIGDDDYGTYFRKTLTEDKVNDKYLFTKQNGTTLHTYIIKTDNGNHCIFANLGNSVHTLSKKEIPENIMDNIDCYYTDMFSAEASLYMGNLAVKKQIPIIFNLQCPPEFMKQCNTTLEDIEKMIKTCSLFIGNKDRFYELTRETDIKKSIKTIYQKTNKKDGVICTLKDKGAIWYDGQEYIEVPALKINVADTTGAGDFFIGGIIHSYYNKKMQKKQALQFACACGAKKCMTHGPRAYFNETEILDLTKGY